MSLALSTWKLKLVFTNLFFQHLFAENDWLGVTTRLPLFVALVYIKPLLGHNSSGDDKTIYKHAMAPLSHYHLTQASLSWSGLPVSTLLPYRLALNATGRIIKFKLKHTTPMLQTQLKYWGWGIHSHFFSPSNPYLYSPAHYTSHTNSCCYLSIASIYYKEP